MDAIAQRLSRLDELSSRFDRTDWVELIAAALLAAATILASWSAYQSTRWSGDRSVAFSEAGAMRMGAAQAASILTAQIQMDMELWGLWLQAAGDDEPAGMQFLESRFRDEFKPAFDAWVAQVPEGTIPPGSPLDMPEYALAGITAMETLNADADAAASRAQEANQVGDNFVLAAVMMASVLFFAGVGTKFRTQVVRLLMLLMAAVLFIVGFAYTASLPQSIGF